MKAVLLIVAVTLAAGAAHAQIATQTAAQLRSAVYGGGLTVVAPLRSEPPRDFGMPKTAIDGRFAARLDGSLGFLCGLQPKSVTDGAAAAYGVDPHGRFLGLKLHMSFR
ncbi:MAG: hypothetical protein JWP50_308 [Phenylobacterium sp.]|nr:hypothetical protein [Phenylobacterium sp.]MDB5443371.1 hypothetical protein [Phenylobacterium sp.]